MAQGARQGFQSGGSRIAGNRLGHDTPLVEHDSLLLRLDFLTNPSPTAAARNGRGSVYAVTSEQLQRLLNSLHAQLDKLQPGAIGQRR